MKKVITVLIVTFFVLPAVVSLGETPQAPTRAPARTWLDALAAASETEAPPADDAAGDAPPEEPCDDPKCVPLPFHCIEGYSGGAITPLAYLCNYCNCGCGGGKHFAGPTVSYGFMGIATKRLHVFTVSQAIMNRVEIGYAMNHLYLGSLYDDLRKAGANPTRRDAWLHHLNARVKVIEENSFKLFGQPVPAVTAGVHFKHNHGLNTINRRLGRGLSGIGFKKNYGVDYTVTATKMFPTLAFGRPLILTGGMRLSKAAQLGLLGFSKSYRGSFEGSAVCLPANWLVLGYEFRQKRNPYRQIPGLIGDEDNWHALSASFIVNRHLTISALAGILGHVANASADDTWGIEIKYEF